VLLTLTTKTTPLSWPEYFASFKFTTLEVKLNEFKVAPKKASFKLFAKISTSAICVSLGAPAL
jgi:hypothetical protein